MPSTVKAGTTHERDPQTGSDEDVASAGPSGQNLNKGQRIAKACDRCRKSKSKCEPAQTDGEPCKSCAATSAVCTYTAPSFRRGPPKGYIQALEHRLHQVESVLAAIMSSTDLRCQSIVDELNQDELASYILETVDAGPFGRLGRKKRAIDTSKDNFFASIVAEQPRILSHRSRRQSRATRENVIESVNSSIPQIQITRPTLAWQDRLSARLARIGAPSSSHSQASRPTSSPIENSTDSVGLGSEPPRRKRRFEGPSTSSSMLARVQPLPPPKDTDVDDLADCADAFGNLSIDENREVRYHGNAAGLQLLVHTERTDGRHTKGIWRFPMAKFWPGPAVRGSIVEVDHARVVEESMSMPPIHVQDHLIQVFFTYVNPSIPVMDKESFMQQYDAQKFGLRDPEEDVSSVGVDSEVRPERLQKISKLLLLSMFAYAASYTDPLESAVGGARSRAEEYAKCARMILDTVYHESRSSTVQALVLLGIREFGTGSLEEGWLHIGMATRMALDLGLNRNADKWMHNGRELFTEKEKFIRKRIWWACCLADKFSALFLGRTIGIHEGDFSTLHLEVPADDAEQMWQPCSPDPLCNSVSPVPAAYTSYFRYLSLLYIITGEVLAKIYRVSHANTTPSRKLREQLYQRLTQWALDLPDVLKYSIKSTRPCPAPHILAMHIQYWATVLLMHRPFIPKGSDLARAGSPSLDQDPIPWESYDICQSAAIQVASFAMLYHEKYDMRWAPPFLANCIQASGVLHVVTLRYKPLDTQASIAIQNCISALTGMERTWTTALRVRHLIQNAKVDIDRTFQAPSVLPGTVRQGRQKRPAQIAFEHDAALYSAPPAHVPTSSSLVPPPYVPMTHVPPMIPWGSEPSERDGASQVFAGYMPGYDSWWPVLDHQPDTVAGESSISHVGAPPHVLTTGTADDTGGFVGPSTGPHHAVLPTSHEFTFGTQQFSPDFLHAMRDPVIHFPSVFAHPQY